MKILKTRSIFLVIGYTAIFTFVGYYFGKASNENVVCSNSNIIQTKSSPTSERRDIEPIDTSDKKVKNNIKLRAPDKRKLDKDVSILYEEAYQLEKYPVENIQEISKIYEEILAKDDKSEKALSSFSNSLIGAREYDAALEIIRKCLKYFPKNELCNGNYSNIFLFQQKVKKAKVALDKCLEVTPENSMCHLNLASYYMQTNEHAKAIEQYQLLLSDKLNSSISHDRSFLFYQLANAYLMDGQKKIYHKYLNKACEEGESMACDDIEKNESN